MWRELQMWGPSVSQSTSKCSVWISKVGMTILPPAARKEVFKVFTEGVPHSDSCTTTRFISSHTSRSAALFDMFSIILIPLQLLSQPLRPVLCQHFVHVIFLQPALVSSAEQRVEPPVGEEVQERSSASLNSTMKCVRDAKKTTNKLTDCLNFVANISRYDGLRQTYFTIRSNEARVNRKLLTELHKYVVNDDTGASRLSFSQAKQVC